MQYERWAPRYAEIRAAFGFPFDREVASARRLRALLPPAARADPLARIERRVAGREAVIVGLAPRAGPPPLWRLPSAPAGRVLVAADGAAAVLADAGFTPDLVVTDLDGPVEAEVAANAKGALVLVHAHGDNLPALERWVPEFGRELAGSWAGAPSDGLIDVGGFTDGDRAAYLLEHVGARRVLLWGFAFDETEEEDAALRAAKLKKLLWAERLLSELAAVARCPIERWLADGSISPVPATPPGRRRGT